MFSLLNRERERLERKYASLMREDLRLGGLVSYVGNKEVPFLRLYRYKEAFGLSLVKEFIRRFKLGKEDLLFDPFCGMGTTPFTGMLEGIQAVGLDMLPVAVFIARTLPRFFEIQPGSLHRIYARLRKEVKELPPAEVALDVAIMQKAFPPANLLALRKWKSAIDSLEEPFHSIFLLLFFSILEPCSYTSKDGQFLRLRRNKRIKEPAEALESKVREAEEDLQRRWAYLKSGALSSKPRVYQADARDPSSITLPRPVTAIITSPPYANRYDYTRTYSLELCFHFVRSFQELKALRFSVLRSHIEVKVSPGEKAPHAAVAEVLEALQRKELNNPRIPYMLLAYFVDMDKVLREWAKVMAPGGKVAMVVDNVRFAGETVPVDLILSEMAEEVGFTVEQILVARYKGNSSQQMQRYGRVPVRESILVWRKEG